MIKVLYVINTLENKGPCNVLLTLLNNIDREKIYPVVMTLFAGNDLDYLQELDRKGVEVTCLNMSNRFKAIRRIPSLLSNFCSQNGFDILHSQCFFSDLVCSKTKFEGSKISTLHNVCYIDYLYQYGKVKGRILSSLHIKALKKMDSLVCCSESVYEGLSQKISEKLTFINNGTDKKHSKKDLLRQDLGLNEDSNVFIYVGSIDLRKNVRELVSNFVSCCENNDYLLILGEGPDIEYCRKIANRNVIFLGFVHNPEDYYKISDFYVSSSLSEGLSLSQIDALSYGLIQLVSDIPSHRIPFKVNESIGALFNRESFKLKFEKVKEMKKNLQRETIKEVYKYHFSGKAMSDKYEKLYEQKSKVF